MLLLFRKVKIFIENNLYNNNAIKEKIQKKAIDYFIEVFKFF